jgi:flavodoxin
MHSLHIIYASTSGHTEYVIDHLIGALSGVEVEKQRVELARPEDLLKGDMLILACGTWNTGSIEGQLNPHMYDFLLGRAAGVDLKGKEVAVIGLGDERYHFTCKAADHLEEFVKSHYGQLHNPTLRIINEPYGQEDKVKTWANKLLQHAHA